MRRQRGIALIQVLLIGGIIGLLMLQLGLTAREQIARAQALSDRAEAELYARSRESALVFSMLTEPLVARPGSANPYAAAWNFRGGAFEADGVRLRIQDQSGLMRIPTTGTAEFTRLLESLGAESGRARSVSAELMELQLGPGRTAAFPVQVVDELRKLPDMDAELFDRLRPLLTLYPTPGFNPLTAPDVLLAQRLAASQLEAIDELRAEGRLDDTALWKLTGVGADEMTVVAPGPAFDVEILARHKGVEVRRRTTYVVRPYRDDAVAVWQRERTGTAQIDAK